MRAYKATIPGFSPEDVLCVSENVITFSNSIYDSGLSCDGHKFPYSHSVLLPNVRSP